MFTILDKPYDCYIAVTLEVIGGKWKTLVLWYLIDGKKRFSELKKDLRMVLHPVKYHQLFQKKRK